MPTYRFEIQLESTPSAPPPEAPYVFESNNNAAATAVAEALAKQLRLGLIGKLIGPDGSILWMGAPDRRL